MFLCSPETAAASALKGVITDPRTLGESFSEIKEPDVKSVDKNELEPPLLQDEAKNITLEKGPNIVSIPEMDSLPDKLEVPIMLKMGDNVSTDEILAGGARVLPYRSNLPEISKFCFEIIDPTYYKRSKEIVEHGGHAITAGYNYGQGSSREHAALAPRYLGLKVAIVKDFARIHWQNLVNFGVLPLTFKNHDDYDLIEAGDVLLLKDLHTHVRDSNPFFMEVKGKDVQIEVEHVLSHRQKEMLLAGGLINQVKMRQRSG